MRALTADMSRPRISTRSPRLAEMIYADALHDFDLRRKVLMAATALEVAVKDMLLRVAER